MSGQYGGSHAASQAALGIIDGGDDPDFSVASALMADRDATYRPDTYKQLDERRGHHSGTQAKIDVENERYPYCIVWSPLPPITWIFPPIGHMGIADSRGAIWDFAGPYTINRDQMAFGAPTRYLKLNPRLAEALIDELKGDNSVERDPDAFWDECVGESNCYYSKRMHNICCQNCHSHVAYALSRMRYRGIRNWNMFMLGAWVFFCGRFPTTCRAVATFLPFCIFVAIILAVRYSSG